MSTSDVAGAFADHETIAERAARGRAVRQGVPRSTFGRHELGAERVDPVAVLEQQNATREPDLVPVRHARMLVSPFTFFRGAAAVMAADLARVPSTGLTVQLCGDAHLANFGVYASPERRLVFDCNDFDETLPGPFEYDVARLASSLVLAARDNGVDAATCRATAEATTASYASSMAEFAETDVLDLHYLHVDAEAALADLQAELGSEHPDLRHTAHTLRKARRRTSLQAVSKLTEIADGARRFASDPPLLVPVRELPAPIVDPEELFDTLAAVLTAYLRSLPDHIAHVLRQFQPIDVARKVVGVGSVGTRCWVLLLRGRDDDDLLVLQVKEATASVLEAHLGPSRYEQPGERVVQGQRLMQSASDPFLGFTPGILAGRYYYWRQLRDMKGSIDTARITTAGLQHYGELCARVLARAHACTGDSIAIAGYLGGGGRFAAGMADFAVRYADRSERDHAAVAEAARAGRLPIATDA
jgi:uncharacterized protein (DUF2252 family)